MQLVSNEKNGALIVSVDQERLDAHGAVEFKQQMSGFIAAGNRNLVLDLSAVSFIDSSGLGAIVSSLKLLGGEGNLVICGLHNNTMSMFKLTRMDRVFNLFDSADDALADIAA
jgi:anti-sigma B factor antagonist